MNPVSEYLRFSVESRRALKIKVPEDFQYTCIEDYVYRHGRLMKSAALTEEELEIVMEAVRRAESQGFVREIKQCFSNAQLIVLHDDSDELIYHEGYAMGRVGIPVHHAWFTINGKVVDLTWKLKLVEEDVKEAMSGSGVLGSDVKEHPVGKLPKGYYYVGVPIENRDYLRFRICCREMVGSLLDDWEAGFPLLRGIDPHDDESVGELVEQVKARTG